MGKFDDDGLVPVDDPDAAMFAECETEEDVRRVMRDLAQNPTTRAHITHESKVAKACSACGSTAVHHVAYVAATGKCVS